MNDAVSVRTTRTRTGAGGRTFYDVGSDGFDSQ